MGRNAFEPSLSLSGVRFLTRLFFVDELCSVRRLRREALPLPYLGDQGVEHVGGDGLPELEVSVPHGFAGGGRCITSLRSKVSAAGISPSIIERISFWSMFTSFQRLPLMTLVTAPMSSVGPFTSMPKTGSRRVGFALRIAPRMALLIACFELLCQAAALPSIIHDPGTGREMSEKSYEPDSKSFASK